ncbi:hypothetical protein [Ramlibacter albus]|uniref:Uncharacterized protein n=1 Tax=Ramlibacter albus TaxID=2079448 RepID=A0A923M560_9BURK|nr:hypothetical protein [Ramlibacter albus]MBC5764145.1 hypothetical protein [Ramlibacter albus]
MFAAVEKLYRDGRQVVPQWPPLVGQLGTYMQANDTRKQCLRLWPLDYQENVMDRYTPLAVLWLPELVAIVGDQLLVRGFEEAGHRPQRNWVFQKWRCQIMDRAAANRVLEPDRRFGHLAPAPPRNR